MWSCGESVDTVLLRRSCESDMSVGSVHRTDEPVKRVPGMACATTTIAVEAYAVALRAANEDIPDWCVRPMDRRDCGDPTPWDWRECSVQEGLP